MNLATLFDIIVDEIFLDYCENVRSEIERIYLFEACFEDCIDEAVEMIL